MSSIEIGKIPVWFWVAAALALLWNLMGVAAFVSQAGMTAEDLAAMAQGERELYEAIPGWAVGAFAVAVFGGALGCVLLLMRRRHATLVLGASLIGVIVQMVYSLFISNATAVYGPGAVLMPVMVMIIGILLVSLARSATRKAWLR